jgi:hypothetical protein
MEEKKSSSGDFVKWLYKNEGLVRLEKGNIFIKTHTDYEYNFAAERIDTPLRLVWWLHHLCEKRWMDNERVRRLIEVATGQMGVKMYEGKK